MEEGRQQRRARGPRGPYRVRGTSKQLLYLAGLVAGKSKRRAAHDAGYKGCPRRVVADLDRAAFNRAVHEAAEKAGVTLPLIMRKIREGMEARHELPFLTQAGEVVYAKPAVLADVQLQAVQLAAGLLGVTSKARREAEGEQPADEGAVNVLLLAARYDHLTDAELDEAMRRMREGSSSASGSSDETRGRLDV